MEQFMRAAPLILVIVGLTQAIKSIVPEGCEFLKKFLWIVSCGLWVLAAYGYVAALGITEYNTAMIVFAGVLVGLSASGFYEFTKNTVKVFKK